MGQANRRGTFEERKKQAIERNGGIAQEQIKVYQRALNAQAPRLRKQRVSMKGPQLVSAILALSNANNPH